jgi:quinol monooxygenase YgiN
MSQTIVVVAYRAQRGKADIARREIRALVDTVLAREPECAGIEVLQDANEPERFTLIERWPSQAMFLGPHLQQPHIQAFIQGAGEFLAGPPDISFWHAAP